MTKIDQLLKALDDSESVEEIKQAVHEFRSAFKQGQNQLASISEQLQVLEREQKELVKSRSAIREDFGIGASHRGLVDPIQVAQEKIGKLILEGSDL